MANYKWIRPGKAATGRWGGKILCQKMCFSQEDIEAEPEFRKHLDNLLEQYADRMGYDEVELHGIELSGVTYLPKRENT